MLTPSTCKDIPPGSVFLSQGTSTRSLATRVVTFLKHPGWFGSKQALASTFTHAGVYLGGGKNNIAHCIGGSGVTIQSLAEELATVARLRMWANPTLTVSQLQQLKSYCYEHATDPYDNKALLQFVGLHPKDPGYGDTRFICTTYTLRAFKAAGAPIMGERTDDVMPAELEHALMQNQQWMLYWQYIATDKEN